MDKRQIVVKIKTPTPKSHFLKDAFSHVASEIVINVFLGQCDALVYAGPGPLHLAPALRGLLED